MEARSALLAAAAMVLWLGASPALAREDCEGQGSTRLVVQISSLTSGVGEVAVTVYPSDPSKFLAPSGKLLRVRVKAAAPVTRVCFNLPRPDIYAVVVYHDANANRNFDRNRVGLPTEGFAFSNDAPTKFGVPSFDAARFEARAGETVQRIKMRYSK